MPINAVLFDLDDTLLWDERSIEEAFQYACEAAGDSIDPKELEIAVRREARSLYESYETFPFTKMIGINPFEALWANFSAGEQQEFRQLEQLAPGYRKESWRRGLASLGVDDEQLADTLASRFAAERRNRPYMYEETLQILDELKGKVKLLLLTNGCPALQQEKLDGVPDLIPYFDHIVISGSFGKGKPDKEIFQHALSLLDISPEQGMMVGDKLTTDILGGRTTGLTTVWINRTGKTPNPEIQPDYEIKHLSELLPLVQTL
ncbi:haloacid dehalogenase [Paenibacillus sp. PK3_47]|uniref:HAD family hydrolase n=1 Tax=Paenibacillus sp. PK3_47 TaxID=2072642 RepID=UPI00201DDE95|nr:HAD family hydrolase [Paenibacillus sp. PK3_47]UQZ37159.1 haloacid dehalogenase [Paenibacillus sp. PK3_47]